jgi:hypothetical protein
MNAKTKAPEAETPPVVETPPELESAIGEVKRAKVGRGSRRRIERAINVLNAALDEATKELDMQVFLADAEGNRIAEWPVVPAMRDFKNRLNEEVNMVLAV